MTWNWLDGLGAFVALAGVVYLLSQFLNAVSVLHEIRDILKQIRDARD